MKLLTTLNKPIANVRPEVYPSVEKWILREAATMIKDGLEKDKETMRKNAPKDDDDNPVFTFEEQQRYNALMESCSACNAAIADYDSALVDFKPTEFDQRLLYICAFANMDEYDVDDTHKLSFGKSTHNNGETLPGFKTVLHNAEWLKAIRASEGENSKKYKDSRVITAKTLINFWNKNYNLTEDEIAQGKSVCFMPQKISIHVSKCKRVVEEVLDWLGKDTNVHANSTATQSVNTRNFWKSMAGYLYTRLTNIDIVYNAPTAPKTDIEIDSIQDDEVSI